ncbi:amino acid adenylation domain-containing protein [Pseudomonas sp. REB1044]|uniref:non-ribosomal peptide synthetase n=1 Tax=Pseudomonas sp. REB1044 TaxID=2675224 RepID=UPI00315D811B
MHESLNTSGHATPQEQAQWLIATLDPQDIRYTIGLAFTMFGRLQPEALQFAWERLLSAHPILSTRYPGPDARASPMCDTQARAMVDLVNTTTLDERANQALVQQWFDRPFDVIEGPIVRLGCFIRPDDTCVVVLAAHHIIADFTSLGLMLDELESLYLDEVMGDGAIWRPRSAPFSHYRREVVTGALGAGGQHQAYWHRYLASAPEPLRWSERWRTASDEGASHCLTVEGVRLQALRALAKQTQASLYTLVLVSWALAVSRATGQDEVMVGMPMSMRDDRYAHTLGSLFNVLPLRVKSSCALQERIKDARTDLHQALEHRMFDLSEALDTLGITRPLGRNPLFQTTVNMLGHVHQSRWLALQMADADAREQWAGMDIGSWPLLQQQGQVDIALEFVDAVECLRMVVKCDPRSFSRTGMTRFAEHWLQCVDELLNQARQDNASVPLASSTDINRIPGPLNSGPREAARDWSLIGWFDDQCARFSDAPALRHGDETLDYQSVQRLSVALALELLEGGPLQGARIGIYLNSGVDAIIAMLAIMRVGASYVPLDPAIPMERMTRILEQAEIGTVVADCAMPAQLNVARWCDMSCHRSSTSSQPLALFDFSSCQGRAYSVFTSGSTGVPKGIDVRHCNVVALLESMYLELDLPAGHVWTWMHAASFDLSIWEIWGALCSAGCLVVVPQSIRSNPEQLFKLLEDEKVSVITQTPSGLRQLAPVARVRPPLGHARHWVVCGEALPGAVARDFLSNEWRLWNLYGPAETTVFATIQPVDASVAAETIVPIGRPLGLASLYLLDGTTAAQPGSVAEIVIGGAGVSLGYIGLDQSNRERFIQDPYRAGGVAYRTGDLGYWDGHRLCFIGRMDEQVKFNGHRIELAEIERCLEGIDEVQQAGALIEDVAGQSRLTALVQWRRGATPLNDRALRAHLRQRLPTYMLPTRLLSVPGLPHNRHAKLDRKALAALVEQLSAVATVVAQEPSSWHQRVQRILCDIFERDPVDLDTPYFDLGGNSMTLLQIHAQLEAWPEARHLRPSDLFRLVTGRMLADELQRHGKPEIAPMTGHRSRRENVLRDRQAGRSLQRGAENE